MNTLLPISLVVPTFERTAILSQTLPSWLAQPVSEIVLVDDGSRDDPTPRVQDITAGDDRVRVVRLTQNRGSCGARNIGLDEARQPWILACDDDVLLDRNYVRILFEHTRNSNADLAAGRRLWLRDHETPSMALESRTRRVEPSRLVDRKHISFDDEADFDKDRESPLVGAIMLGRKALFTGVRYEETLFRRTGWREETDFQIRCALAGARLMACPHALCFHLAKSVVGRQGGQRAGRLLMYEWNLLRNNVRFLRRHHSALVDKLGFRPGLTPWLGALRAYFGFRLPSKIRHVLGGGGP